ncbi:MAG: hypothetical protein ACRD82_01450 [Blastocatellia bacterium]
MANEDNTRQINVDGQVLNEVLSTVRELSTRYTSQEERISAIEQIILNRLNDTRPFDHQVMDRINELTVGQNAMREDLGALREDLVALREDLGALREDFNEFRQETNHNFRLVNQKLGHLNDDFLEIRAEHTLLEKRVDKIEERIAA